MSLNPFQGILSSDEAIASVMSTGTKSPRTERHFSTFPLTSHLHSALLRIVSRHPFLSVKLVFMRVPEIHDGFEWKVYISRSTTVKDVIHCVCEQLGLVKSLPVPGGGSIEYAIEKVSDSESGMHSSYVRRPALFC